MGGQIGFEYALAGHHVVLVSRDAERSRRHLEDVLHEPAARDLFDAERRRRAWTHVEFAASPVTDPSLNISLIVESLPEDFGTKVRLLGAASAIWPDATVASNTSSLSLTELGEAIDAPERLLGTHYWNPPLFMPLVEVIAGSRTDPARLHEVEQSLRELGKTPVPVHREVPGFIWNRLQLALLREALWLVDNGVTDPETVDKVVRDGLARRMSLTGPFQTAALGGVETFASVARNLLPALSSAHSADSLRRWVDDLDAETLEAVRQQRDRALAHHIRSEQDVDPTDD